MEEKSKNRFMLLSKEYGPFILAIICILVVRGFVFTPINVNGTSMNPTLRDGDIMILNKIGLKTEGIKRFDIVVVREDKKYIIKRVMALPGESIYYKDGELYINEKKLEDKYNNDNTEDFDVVNLGADEYFVMGDNRSVSKDSRLIGPINKKDILGKTNFTILPIRKFGKVE